MLNKDEIQGIADEVVKELKSDFEEKVYQEAFLAELRFRQYEYDRERVIPVLYRDQQVGFVLGGHPKPAIDGQLKTGHRK